MGLNLKHLIVATFVFLTAVLLHASLQPATAGTCSIDNLPTTGTMTASKFNSRWTQVEGCVNGNIGDANWDSSDPLSVGNVENNQSVYTVGPILFDAESTTPNNDPFQVAVNSTITGWMMRCATCAGGSIDVDIDLVYEDTPTIVDTVNFTAATTFTDFTLSKAVTSGTDINFDVTANAGTCSTCSAIVYLKTQHVQ